MLCCCSLHSWEASKKTIATAVAVAAAAAASAAALVQLKKEEEEGKKDGRKERLAGWVGGYNLLI